MTKRDSVVKAPQKRELPVCNAAVGGRVGVKCGAISVGLYWLVGDPGPKPPLNGPVERCRSDARGSFHLKATKAIAVLESDPMPSRGRPIPPPVPAATDPEPAQDDPPSRSLTASLAESSPWLVSFVVHFVVLLLLGLITCTLQGSGSPLSLLATSTDAPVPLSSISEQPLSLEPDRRQGAAHDASAEVTPVELPLEVPPPIMAGGAPATKQDTQPAASVTGQRRSKSPPAMLAAGGGLEGRTSDARAGLAGQAGGSRASEEAVERGLRWLAAHQRNDGSWCFDLSKSPCGGLCRNSGRDASTTAATALALLPFLGAGYTHREGEHQETVKRALYFLGTRARVTPHGVDFQDAVDKGMYGQGIATIALCEAYGMTRDASLKDVAQQAIRFIVFAQDVKGGGWRYTPGAPGDVTVTGWQLMAMKSAQLAGLEVPSPAISLVERFLDSVQTEGGARYNYMLTQPPRQTNCTTAVGLLCRMYTGWHRDNPALYRGVAYLDKWGRSDNDMYYNYYATQVLHHWGGPEWQTWNPRMRDYLIATQGTTSHEAGSWHFPDPYGDVGGRLYNTALATLTLEVYYRYLPLFAM